MRPASCATRSRWDTRGSRSCSRFSKGALATAADVLGEADTVYLLAQLRSAPVAEVLGYVLTMLGKRTILLDPGGGLTTHLAKVARNGDVLFVVSFRFHATEVGQQMIRDTAVTLKKVSMEPVGNAPVIVYDDADLEAQLNVAVPFKFANAGHFFEPTILTDCTNEMGLMAASEAPFGGTNHSRMGGEGGIEGIRDYRDVKSSQMVWA